jgi:nitroreductase
MEVFEAVRTMLAVRQYQDRPVSEDLVRRIVESAHLTASSRNGQPWHFTVVQDRGKLQELGSLARTGPYIAQSALTIVVSTEESPYGMSDCSRAIQSMMLTAWSEGVGSNWVGFANLEHLKEPLGIPAGHTVIAAVPFGYPVARIGRGKKNRRPLGEIASRERFGQPFS